MTKVKILTLSMVAATLIGCSSSDNSTSNNNPSQIVKGELLDINESNQDKVLASSLSVFKLDEALNSTGADLRLTNEVDDKVYANEVLELTLAKRVESHECQSGKVTIDDNDNGVNQDLDVNFENCINDGITIDGLIHYNTIKDIKNFDAVATNLKVAKDDKEVFYENAILKVEDGNLSETLTGYAKDGNESVTFKDFKINVKKLSSLTKYSVDGALATSCIDDKWLDIKTTQDIEKNSTLDCPTAGVVEIKGDDNSTIKAEYKSDESINIYLDGNLTKTYSSCDEMSSDVEAKCK